MTNQEAKLTIDMAIDEVINGGYQGMDLANLSLMYPNKDNAVKIAEYLLSKGLYEQYASMLILNNELNMREEFERVKRIDNAKGYMAIANFLPYADMVYCQQKVMQEGTGLDIVKFMLNVRNANKAKAISTLIERNDANSLGYAVKYLDDSSFQFLEQSNMMSKIKEIVKESGSVFARNAIFEREIKWQENPASIKTSNVKSNNNSVELFC